jgi:dihydrofolate reductase
MPSRDLIITENITLDGVIDAAGDWFAVGNRNADQTDMIEALAAQRAGADAVLLGRRTFESFRGFWPHQHDDPTGVSDYLNAVAKYVVSGTLGEPGWDRTTVLRGPLHDEVRALKERPGKDIVATGSLTLVGDLVGSGLVDEYRLFVYPVVLGRGTRLFERADGAGELDLVEATRFASGVVLLRYRSA